MVSLDFPATPEGRHCGGPLVSQEKNFEDGSPVPPPWHLVEAAAKAALAEDLGLSGDVTTAALVDQDASGRGLLVFRYPGVLAGTWTTEAVCSQFDLTVKWRAGEGEALDAGDVAGEIEGLLPDLLVAERTVLNFLSHLSGIATCTRAFVETVATVDIFPTIIRDTRKTAPGLRALEKAAVRAGGGRNHRMGLFDAILVKDNHLAALRKGHQTDDFVSVIDRCGTKFPGLPIEIEVDTIAQAEAAATAGADLLLLDNMTPEQVSQVVKRIGGEVPIEVSGGVTLENVADYAAAGAHYIAVGAITHSAAALDIGLDFADTGQGFFDEFDPR